MPSYKAVRILELLAKLVEGTRHRLIVLIKLVPQWLAAKAFIHLLLICLRARWRFWEGKPPAPAPFQPLDHLHARAAADRLLDLAVSQSSSRWLVRSFGIQYSGPC
jgi:hypothetical protein